MSKKFILLLASLVLLLASLSCAASRTLSPDDGKTWISPGKLRITNLPAGGRAKGEITIHNGRQAAETFSIYLRVPDYVENGFAAAPTSVKDWVEIREELIVMAPRETKSVPVSLSLPAGSEAPGRWEFWIGVKEDDGSKLATELCSRWLITMKGH